MNRLGYIRRMGVLFGALLGMACLLGCENDLSKVNTISSKLLEVSVETSRGIHVTYSDSAKVKAVMSSPLLLTYQTEEPYQLMPEGLYVEFYDDSMKIESTLSAKYGRRDLEKKTMEVRDSVVVLSADGRTLETERLVWEEEGDRIYTDRFVKMTDADGYVTQGSGLETNSRFEPYTIGNYKGEIPFKSIPDSLSRRDSLSRADTAAVPGIAPGADRGPDTTAGPAPAAVVPGE